MSVKFIRSDISALTLTYISTAQNTHTINGAGVDSLVYVNIDSGNVTNGSIVSDSASYTGTVIQVKGLHSWTVLKDCTGKYNGADVTWKAGYTWYDAKFPTIILVAD